MRDFLAEYGIQKYINAHDTITLYGASRMSEETFCAMKQISESFVDMVQLQSVLSARIAKLTRNEDAYIANCAAGALTLCAAVCISGDNEAAYRALPKVHSGKNEIVVLHGQHNCYDKALEACGAKIIFAGDADGVPEFELSAAITENTAAVFYCPALTFARASIPLKIVSEIAHAKGVPVIVDAAAQLPPLENLWKFCEEGGDMVVFSGGKSLCGPQTSGLIVGKTKYMSLCRRFGAPMHGICRGAKASRESMIGLCTAVEAFVNADHDKINAENYEKVHKIINAMSKSGVYKPYIVEHGSVGQSYPRAFAKINVPHTPQRVIDAMRRKYIYIGYDKAEDAVYVSPQNLTSEECEEVCKALCEI